jgi:hypothetical protein
MILLVTLNEVEGLTYLKRQILRFAQNDNLNMSAPHQIAFPKDKRRFV